MARKRKNKSKVTVVEKIQISKPTIATNPRKKKSKIVVVAGPSTGKSARKRRARARKRAQYGIAGGSMGPMTQGQFNNPLFNAIRMRNNATIVDSFRLRREKVANFNGTPTFTNMLYYINPGNTALFPIFSTIASCYTEFRFRSLKFLWFTEAYTANGSGASAGKVIMSVNFNPAEVAFNSDTQMENYQDTVKDAPYVNLAYVMQHIKRGGVEKGLDMDKVYTVNYANNIPNPAPLNGAVVDVFQYNVGTFQFATNGNAVTSEMGELYVEFEVDLIRPRQPITALGTVMAHAVSTPSPSNALVGLSVKNGSSSQLIITSPTANVLNVATSPSLFGYICKIDVCYTQSGGTAVPASNYLYGTGVTTGTNLYDGDTSYISQSASAASFNVSATFVAGISSVYTIGFNTLTLTGGTGYAMDIWVTILPGPLVSLSSEDRVLEIEKRIDEKLAKLQALFHGDDLIEEHKN